jgi:hypothetical protein
MLKVVEGYYILNFKNLSLRNLFLGAGDFGTYDGGYGPKISAQRKIDWRLSILRRKLVLRE